MIENSDYILYNSFILNSAIVLDYMRLMRNNNNNNIIHYYRGGYSSAIPYRPLFQGSYSALLNLYSLLYYKIIKFLLF